MANISDVQGNIPKIKHTYKKLLSMGEGVAGDEFLMRFEGEGDITFLVQTTQVPPIMRENIESYGPLGVQFNQQGRYKNAQDLPISFKEVITGKAYTFVKDWVENKKYLQVTLALVGESYPEGPRPLTWILEDCWIELEGADLSVEDGSSLVRPSGTLHANWVSIREDEVNQTITVEG